MAWTAPMTAVAGVFTASNFNIHVRDNLLETAPAKATSPGMHMVTSGTNRISGRFAVNWEISQLETTTSTSYTNLATIGPRITVNTGTRALVFLSALTYHSVANGDSLMGVVVSGATTIAASDEYSLAVTQSSGFANQAFQLSTGFVVTGLNPGNNTFTAQYKIVVAGTGTWGRRKISVIPF